MSQPMGVRMLITGGAGCLGSNLIEQWLPVGHQITVIDNFATGKREVVPPMPGLEVVEGSVADEALVYAVFSRHRPEVVVHAAASYRNPDDWAEDIHTNILGSAHVARAACAFGVSRLVNFQTALCYGRPRSLPIPVDHPTAPFTSYGITKTAGEQFMLQSEVPTLSLRLANVTGPRLAIGPIPTFYKRLKQGAPCFCSDSSRDFLDMTDFLAFMDLAIRRDAPTGIFNVSSGEARSISEVFRTVAEHVGCPSAEAPLRPIAADDVSVMALDPAETEQAFGWRSRIGFRETVRRQLEWYDRYGVSDVHSHLKEPTVGQ